MDPLYENLSYDVAKRSLNGINSYNHVVSSKQSDDTECLPDSSHPPTWQLLLPGLLLAAFNVVVLVGNSLVIMSVFTCKKLRTITNTYIVSLAFSDLFLGILVLPFSGTKEVLTEWPFGKIWCDMWLAIDVWLCTASILNLCAISFDRYLAITRPFKYQAMVSPLKAKLLVAGVWVVAFLVCLPSLIGWNEKGKSVFEVDDNKGLIPTTYVPKEFVHNITNSSVLANFEELQTTTAKLGLCHVSKECELNLEVGYVIYSALGSFWIPVWIMMFFYGRIYIIAARTTRGVKRGVVHTKELSSTGELRIHRGGTLSRNSSVRSTSRPSVSQTEVLLPSTSVNMEQRTRQLSICEIQREDTENLNHRQLKRNASVPAEMGYHGQDTMNGSHHMNGVKPPKIKVTFCRKKNMFSKLEESPISSPNRNGIVNCPIEEESSFTQSECLTVNDSFENGHRRSNRRTNLKSKLKAFNKEKKAAKTVGIIVGCFVCCWAPFFTVYLLEALCGEACKPPDLVFTVFFWLGYSNSAINPFVYALFSKDFRFAFKKLLCCKCERKKTGFHDRRASRFRKFLNSMKIQISSRSSDDTNLD